MFYDIRDYLFNHAIVWMMNHCHCWSHVFYTACRNYYPTDVRTMFNAWSESVKEERK